MRDDRRRPASGPSLSGCSESTWRCAPTLDREAADDGQGPPYCGPARLSSWPDDGFAECRGWRKHPGFMVKKTRRRFILVRRPFGKNRVPRGRPGWRSSRSSAATPTSAKRFNKSPRHPLGSETSFDNSSVQGIMLGLSKRQEHGLRRTRDSGNRPAGRLGLPGSSVVSVDIGLGCPARPRPNREAHLHLLRRDGGAAQGSSSFSVDRKPAIGLSRQLLPRSMSAHQAIAGRSSTHMSTTSCRNQRQGTSMFSSGSIGYRRP